MNATIIPARAESSAVMLAIDLAKEVFELAFADAAGRIVERKRLKRGPFAVCLENHAPLRVVMEACGSAHAWARRLARLGHSVELLPAPHVRPYVRRNKTDRADAAGLLEAARCGFRSRTRQPARRTRRLIPFHFNRTTALPQHRFARSAVAPPQLMQACRSPTRPSR